MSESLNDEDMVYNMTDGKIMAGGYSVNSLLLNEGLPALYEGGGHKAGTHTKVSDRFKHLAVPAGLLYINESVSATATKPDTNESAVINDKLYEQLLHLAELNNKAKKYTKSKKGKLSKNKKKTKRRL